MPTNNYAPGCETKFAVIGVEDNVIAIFRLSKHEPELPRFALVIAIFVKLGICKQMGPEVPSESVGIDLGDLGLNPLFDVARLHLAASPYNGSAFSGQQQR